MRCRAHAHGAKEIHIKHLREDVGIEFLIPRDDAGCVHDNVKLGKAIDEFADCAAFSNVKNLCPDRGGQDLFAGQAEGEYISTRDGKRLCDSTTDATGAAGDKHPLSLVLKHQAPDATVECQANG